MFFLRRPFCLLFGIFLYSTSFAQNDNRISSEKCGTMPRLLLKLQGNPQLKARFEAQRAAFTRILSEESVTQNKTAQTEATIYIPVVFHIVMTNPSLVSDAQVQAQLDTLNMDFFGTNGDSVKIPDHFKPFFGKSTIQFCLAKRSPDGEETSGIERISTTSGSFGVDDAVKHKATRGADSWDPEKYFNVWLCSLSNGILGYSSFPEDGSPSEQGVVIDYRSLPGGAFTSYNGGKTLTHETGHYFNLFHIWGDDNGSCSGTDEVGDTPNQAGATSGCFTGVRTDNCTPSGNGIMYQNYMDYSNDECLVMFTKQQVDRMQTALSLYRSSLLQSNGCLPVVLKNYDVQLRAITQPVQRLCSASFTPSVTIRNRGAQPLTTLLIHASLDNGTIITFPWTGLLPSLAMATIPLNSFTTTTGTHVLTIFITQPNNNADEDKTNDTLRMNLQYFAPVSSLSESFESGSFPPVGWDVVNPDGAVTWQLSYAAAKTGNASVVMNNYGYPQIRETDDLRMPLLSIPANADSAFFSFQVAAAAYSDLGSVNNTWDTLEVLASRDCGQTYTSLYKKWGSSLVTRNSGTTTSFTPASTEWSKDSIYLAPYIGVDNLLLAFRNTAGYEYNIYLDDIRLRTVVLNPNLKAQGFLVTPNPTAGNIMVQFYPQPVNLRAVEVYNSMGQIIYANHTNGGQPSSTYNIDLGRYPGGTYFVRAVFSDRVLVKKIIRL
jgi:hypothetical protein